MLGSLAAMMVLGLTASGALNVSWFGRVAVDGSGGRFQWPATGFAVSFEGSWVDVVLEDSAPGTAHAVAGTQSNAVAYRIDGGPLTPLTLKPGSHVYRLAGGLAAGRHRLEVFKRTESSVGWVRLENVLADGMVLPLEVGVDRPLLEVYGDSNSCAYGVEAAGREIHYSPSTQAATKSYPLVATDELGWDLSLISCSGWGVIRGYGGQRDANVPSVSRRVLLEDANRMAEGRAPKVILVMLGDNDFAQGDPGKDFDDGLRSFVGQLRERSPDALIWLGVGPMMRDTEGKKTRSRVSSEIDGIVAGFGNGVKKLEFPVYQEAWGWGADWHFSQAAHVEFSKFLAERLKDVKD